MGREHGPWCGGEASSTRREERARRRPVDLSVRVEREPRLDLPDTGTLGPTELRPEERFQLRELELSPHGHHDRADGLAPLPAGDADDGGIQYGGMSPSSASPAGS